MNPKTKLNKVRALLGLEINLEQMKMENGTILEAETFEAGQDIFVVSPEGDERIALPVGEYEVEGDKIVVVAEEGIISEIKDAEAEAPEEVAEPEMEAQKPEPKKVVESISKELFFAEIEKLKNEITELKAVPKEEVVKEVVELAEEAKPIKHNPEAKAEKDFQKFASNRQMTTRDRVFNKLFN